MKKIALIQSHCNTEEKLSVLKETIKKLSDLELDILLFSHISLPIDIIDSVKYFIYDSTNPILWDERRHVYWWADDFVKLETSVPDYGWTVFNQIIRSYSMIQRDDYEMFYIVCYDLIIDEFVVDKIINNRVGKYRHIKPKNVNEFGDYVDVIFDTSLIFLSLGKNEIESIVNNLNKKEYIDHPEWIAEKYFEEIIDRCEIDLPNLGSVSDLLHESTSVFNQSTNSDYEVFIDSNEFFILRYIKKNVGKKHILVINDEVFEISEDISFFSKNEPIKNLGVLIDGEYDNFLHLINPKYKINKISFYERNSL